MIVLFHTVCYIINEVPILAWQKAVTDITHNVIQAIEEAKKDEAAV